MTSSNDNKSNKLFKIVHEDAYKYSAMFCATFFLVPQVFRSYYTGSAKDVSTASHLMIISGTVLWCLYVFEIKEYYYMAATIFLGLHSIFLICLQIHFYFVRVNTHWKSFDKQLEPVIAATTKV